MICLQRKFVSIIRPSLLITLIVVLVQPFNLYGQSKVGTTMGQFLKIEPGARNAAMGSAGASLSGEALAAFYNPASLGRLPGGQVQFSHIEWLADISYNYLIAAVPVGDWGTFMLQTISLNSGEIDVRTVEQPHGTGERYEVTNFSLGLGYGQMLTDRVSVGFQLAYLRETIWHSSASSFTLNLGVRYELTSKGMTIGASLLNFGPRSKFNGRDLYLDYDFDPDIYGNNDQLPAELRTNSYGLPTTFRAGISFPFQINTQNNLTMALDAIHPNDNNESLNIGAEWRIIKKFVLRGGYRNLFLEDAEGGLVFGGGANIDFLRYNVSVDYAWADYGRLEQAHRFTLGFGF